MTKDTVQGAGGVQSDWAVWGGGKIEPAQNAAAEAIEPLAELRTGDVAEGSILKARYELLERENELLRQRLAIADRQVEVKDSQINDFRVITDSLTRQNQVLLMLAQGVPMERILKGGEGEIEVRPSHSEPKESSPRINNSWESRKKMRGMINLRIEKLVKAGSSQQHIADILNKEGVPTLSGTGKWNRRKVGKMISESIRVI